MKKILKCVSWTLAVVALLAVALVLFLTVSEYKPAEVETVAILGDDTGEYPRMGEKISILS